jgi:hypothetical protein
MLAVTVTSAKPLGMLKYGVYGSAMRAGAEVRGPVGASVLLDQVRA